MPLEITLSRTEPTVRLVCDDCARYVTKDAVVFIHSLGRMEWSLAAYDLTANSGYVIHLKEDELIHVQCPECVQRDWMSFK